MSYWRQVVKIAASAGLNWGHPDEIRFWMRREEQLGGQTKVIQVPKFEWETFDEAKHGYEVQPAFKLFREDAQNFMDQLWDCGLRPMQGAGSAGQLSSTLKHLEDMRALVFAHQKVQAPK